MAMVKRAYGRLLRRSFLLTMPLGFLLSGLTARGQQETVRGDRWLAITALRGPVTIVSRQGRRPARRGDRLATVGDQLTTGPNGATRLAVDQGIGFINVAENTQLQVQTLSITGNGGRVTDLRVTQGQIRLQLRQFNHPESRLNITTPAGVSGVRGTEFGVTVQPNGQTGIATQSGSVEVSAQGVTVTVSDQLQTVIRPGEPPTPPAPLRDDPTLQIDQLTLPIDSRTVRILGTTDRVNLLEIEGQSRALNSDGQFDVRLPLSENRRIDAVVTTPLGTKQKYQLVVP